jgi:alpha-L-rhamnosidase
MALAPSFITPAFASGGADQPAPYLRRDLTVRSGLRKATLRWTAIGLVEASINGTRVGDELLAPGWTSYENRLIVSTHDVTELIREGENTLGAIIGEGWALG